MKKFLLSTALTVFIISSLQGALYDQNSAVSTDQPASAATSSPAQATQEPAAATTPDMTTSAAQALSWLKGVDNGHYEESWDQLGGQAQNVIKKNEWKQVLDAVRKPLGTVVHRDLLNQSPAKNPQGLEPGDYMVLFYKTQFENKPSTYELVTMHKTDDGQWKVLTYQIQ